jgi:hypothetical protein
MSNTLCERDASHTSATCTESDLAYLFFDPRHVCCFRTAASELHTSTSTLMPPYLRFTALSMPSKATRQPMPPFYDAINRCHHDSPLPMPNKPHVNRCHHSTIHRCQMSNTATVMLATILQSAPSRTCIPVFRSTTRLLLSNCRICTPYVNTDATISTFHRAANAEQSHTSTDATILRFTAAKCRTHCVTVTLATLLQSAPSRT